jgi:hypothetical protein
MSAHAVPTTTAPTTTTRALPAVAEIADKLAYWAGLAGIYLAFGFLWFYAMKEKLFDQNGTMPAGLAKAYAGTFVDSFPGVNATWLLLGVAEAVAFLLFIASLATGEFLPSRRKPILLSGIAVSLMIFGLLLFGQSLTANTDGEASIFGYLGATGVIFALVRMVPPFNGGRLTEKDA